MVRSDVPDRIRSSRARGRLVEDRARPVFGVRVFVSPPVGEGSASRVLRAVRSLRPHGWRGSGRTDRLGRFEVDALEPWRSHLLLFVDRRFRPELVWVPPGDGDLRVELGCISLRRCAADSAPRGRTLRACDAATHRF